MHLNPAFSPVFARRLCSLSTGVTSGPEKVTSIYVTAVCLFPMAVKERKIDTNHSGVKLNCANIKEMQLHSMMF